MNMSMLVGIGVLIIGGAVAVGIAHHVWDQRKKADAPESGKYAGSLAILAVTVAVLYYALPNMVTSIGSAAQNLFPASTVQAPNYDNLINQGGGKVNVPTPTQEPRQ